MNEIEKGQLASTTIDCFSRGDGALSNFPGLLKKLIENKAWDCRIHRGRQHKMPNLRALITEKPIAGWGEDPKKIEAIIKDNPEVLALYREAMEGKGGAPTGNQNASKNKQPNNNVIRLNQGGVAKTKQGNSRAYSIDRVKRECDKDTVAKVMSGEMSPNAALVKSGIRVNRQVYIPTDPKKLIPKLAEKFGTEYVKQAIQNL